MPSSLTPSLVCVCTRSTITMKSLAVALIFPPIQNTPLPPRVERLAASFPIGCDLQDYLKPKVLLGRSVEWLPEADPERVEGGVRGKLGRRRLARQHAVWVRRRYRERLVERVLSRRDRHLDRPFVAIERQVFTGTNRMRR